ncbi:exo-alpha-sialidase [Sphingobacterium sp. ML3W]|uniref:sialidase family protein n=1 Tax=Sphingobacterium sp. ML3W TaxID=1538644 RepID=UPI00249A6E9A|nr:sialidase family protein [Sphingobacterium sp. ML3W]WFA80858.1 exo-alpha-sialidase [Sphingobacterium sp. ML3W]
MITKIHYSLLALFSLLTATSVAQVKIAERHYTLPVLADQPINILKRLEFVADKQQRVDAELRIRVDALGAEQIDSLSCWFAGTDSTIIENGKPGAKQLLIAQKWKGKTGKIKVPLTLEKGVNYLWVTAKVRPFKQLNRTFQVAINGVSLAGLASQSQLSGKFDRYRPAVAVHRQGAEGVHTSRIPGIITAKDGSLVAVYDARRELGRDLQGDIDIGVSRSLDGGRSWLPMETAIDMGTFGGLPQKFNGVSDPNILLNERTGTIYVAGLWMHGVLDETGTWYPGIKDGREIHNHQWKNKGSQPGFEVKQTSQFLLVKSEDNGLTWSKPLNLTHLKKAEWWLWAPAPGHGISLQDGTLLMPSQGRDETGKAFSNITYSKDGGQTWKTSNPALAESTTECMAVQLDNGEIMLNMRSNYNATHKGDDNGRAIAVTKDLGETWTEHPSSHKALIEPTCMASIHRHVYQSGKDSRSLLVFCNPDSKFVRSHITLKTSKDNGDSWQPKVLLDEGKGRGYSCITSVDEHTLGVLYESSQADLIFQQIPLKELL